MMISSLGVKHAIKKARSSSRAASTLSGHYSYASPEADFYNHYIPRAPASSLPAWTRSISHASPENDFIAAAIHDDAPVAAEWSGKLSFASPEADCTAEPEGTAIKWSATSTEWSENLSFASPEADFTAEPEAVDFEWSNQMSYSSPEADFTSQPERASTWEWSEQMSFASPEADFSSQPERASEWEWSEQMSFASPEADFSSQPERASEMEWSEQLSFASPESDFVAGLVNATPLQESLDEPAMRELMASPIMSLAISSPESAFGSLHAHQLLNQNELYKLHQEQTSRPEPLPATVEEALNDTTRAIVITEALSPFSIVDVNDAWVGLCGFSREEARRESLALIQGPETNRQALAIMLNDLLKGNESSALVTNYDKSGRKFYNKLHAGPIKDHHDRITHFVGILQEVTEQPEFFHHASA